MTLQDGKSEKKAAGVRVIDEKIKRKRSRGGREFNSSIIVPTEDENLAHTLVMLRRGGGTGSGGGGDVFTADSEEIIKTRKSFKCDVCERDFASYQALGGHKASHRQKPVTDGAKPTFTSTAATINIEANVSTAPPPGQIPAVEKPHVCPKCGKSFTKGQALGGHMRLHYDGTKGGCKTGGGTKGCKTGGGGGGHDSNCSIVSSVTPSVSQEVGCGAGGAGGISSRYNNTIDLDLNLQPQKEEEEGGGQEIRLDLELRLGDNHQINVDEQKPEKKPRLSLSFAFDF